MFIISISTDIILLYLNILRYTIKRHCSFVLYHIWDCIGGRRLDMQKNHLSSHHPDIESEQDSSLSIFNENSEFGAYYQMIVPFQITLEYCSGTTDKDYYNFLISSQSGTYSFTNPYFESRYYYTNRPLHQHDFLN